MFIRYLFFGFALSVPYTYLSGGDVSCLIAGSFLLPIAVVVLGFGKYVRFGLSTVIGYVLSPILLNGLAICLQLVGAGWSSVLYEYRYYPIVIVPILYLVFDVTSYLRSHLEERRYEMK